MNWQEGLVNVDWRQELVHVNWQDELVSVDWRQELVHVNWQDELVRVSNWAHGVVALMAF